jgi:pyruvate kinase
MPHAGRQLLAAVRELRRSIAGEASGHVERWQREIEQPSFAASVSNLAHYLAFRHHDLREVQRDLMRYGLSSLGRLESRVMITLATVETALDALMSGTTAPLDWPPSSEAFFRGKHGCRPTRGPCWAVRTTSAAF